MAPPPQLCMAITCNTLLRSRNRIAKRVTSIDAVNRRTFRQILYAQNKRRRLLDRIVVVIAAASQLSLFETSSGKTIRIHTENKGASRAGNEFCTLSVQITSVYASADVSFFLLPFIFVRSVFPFLAFVIFHHAARVHSSRAKLKKKLRSTFVAIKFLRVIQNV
jgi:hypothetical protein